MISSFFTWKMFFQLPQELARTGIVSDVFLFVNEMINDRQSFTKLFSPLALLFFNGDMPATFTTSLRSTIFSKYQDIGIVSVVSSNRNDVLAECWPSSDNKLLSISETFLTFYPRNIVQLKNFKVLLFLIILHECAHFLTPIMNEIQNIPKDQKAPPHIGAITLPDATIMTSDCGYAMEQLILEGGVISFHDITALNDLQILRIVDTSIPATGENIQRFVLSVEQSTEACDLIEDWYHSRERRSPFVDFFCRCSCFPREFPLEQFKSILVCASATDAEETAAGHHAKLTESEQESINVALETEFSKARTMIRGHFGGSPPTTSLQISSAPLVKRKSQVDEFRGHGKQDDSTGSKI